MRRHFERAAALAAALGLTIATAIAQIGGQGPIHLSADQGELDNAKGVSTYTGNVVLTRGELKITGDVMRVFTGDERELERIDVEGEPATYRDLPEREGQPVRAQAPRMEYFANGPERIKLLRGAKLWQGDNEFSGRTIVYDVQADRVEAESGGEGERVEITLYPNAESEKQ